MIPFILRGINGDYCAGKGSDGYTTRNRYTDDPQQAKPFVVRLEGTQFQCEPAIPDPEGDEWTLVAVRYEMS